jgi:hypothetical protein
MISAESFSGTERINRGEFPSEKTCKLIQSQSVLYFDDKMHLFVKGAQGRCAYCSIKDVELRSNIECFTCK